MFCQIVIKDSIGRVIRDTTVPTTFYLPGGYQFQGKYGIINNDFEPIYGKLTTSEGDVFEGKLSNTFVHCA